MTSEAGLLLRDLRDAVGARGQFEREEAGLVSFATYRREGRRLIIEHVETPPAARRSGAASQLMAAIVERAVAEGAEIAPECGYAAAWLARRGVPERIRKGAAPDFESGPE